MALTVLEGVVGNAAISVVVPESGSALGNICVMEITRTLTNGSTFITSSSGTYKNAKMLSEALRDEVGFGPAKNFFESNGVPANSPLMYLGVNN